jgi:CheY-like chemotaxis protein
MLDTWSIRSEAADNVPDALAKIHHAVATGAAYRLVFVQAALPGLDGCTLAKWLWEEPGLAGPAVLLIPEGDRLGYLEQCRQFGALYLEEPWNESTLLSAIASALRTSKAVASSDELPGPTSPSVALRRQ